MEKCQMLSASECARRYHVDRASWYRMVKAGEAPEPMVIGQQKLWAMDDLVEWEETVMESCDERDWDALAAS